MKELIELNRNDDLFTIIKKCNQNFQSLFRGTGTKAAQNILMGQETDVETRLAVINVRLNALETFESDTALDLSDINATLGNHESRISALEAIVGGGGGNGMLPIGSVLQIDQYISGIPQMSQDSGAATNGPLLVSPHPGYGVWRLVGAFNQYQWAPNGNTYRIYSFRRMS